MGYKVFAYSETGCVSQIVEALTDDDGKMRWEIHQGRNEEELMWVRVFESSAYSDREIDEGRILEDFHGALHLATNLLVEYKFIHVEPFVD